MFGQHNLLESQLTTENIFKYVSDYEIFRYYCGNFDIGKRFHSPLRKDRNPSFAISKWGDFFYWKDFSTGQSGNCFTLVMNKFGSDFRGALQRINIDFNLGLESSEIKLIERTPYVPEIKNKVQTDIRICSREWRIKDLEYWNSFGIEIDTLELYKVKSISHFYINGHFYSTGTQLAFSYEFPDGYKLYFPEKEDGRWFTNSRYIQGLRQLNKERDTLIITKSLKDVMALHEIDVSAIAPQAESIILSEKDIIQAKRIFKNIYTLFDYDNAGIHLAWQMRKLYNIEPLFLTDGLWKRKKGLNGCKDVSEYIRKYGKLNTQKVKFLWETQKI